jgi:hypothetical protein
MELETLYQRYCIRLKHALFLSCLTVAVVTSAVLLVTTCILQVVQGKIWRVAPVKARGLVALNLGIRAVYQFRAQ